MSIPMSAHALLTRHQRAALRHHVGASGDDCNATSILGGIANVSDVTAKDTELAGYVEALNTTITSCPGMTSADRELWSGIYAQWTLYHSEAVDLANGTGPYSGYDAIARMIEASNILCRFAKVSAQVETFRARAAAVCGPNVPPAPPPPGGATPSGSPPSAGESWLCRTLGVGCTTGIPDAVKWAAIAAIVIVGSVYVLPVAVAAVAALGEHARNVRGLLPAK